MAKKEGVRKRLTLTIQKFRVQAGLAWLLCNVDYRNPAAGGERFFAVLAWFAGLAGTIVPPGTTVVAPVASGLPDSSAKPTFPLSRRLHISCLPFAAFLFPITNKVKFRVA
jgi:hypothetical protein